MPKFIKKILKKRNSNNFDFEEILQEATLQKYNNHENKLYVKISSFYIYLIFFIFLLFSGYFIYSAYNLQIINFETYERISKNNQFNSTPIFSLRGSVYDRNDVPLITNEKISTTADDYKRLYTEKDGFAHLLGYTTPPQKDAKGIYWQENFKGIGGIEEYYDKLLAGVSGKEFFEVNSQGKKEKSFIVDKPIPGKNINLTIDAELQEKAHTALRSFINLYGYKGGAAIMMNIKNGEIIYLTNYPEFKNNKVVSDKNYFQSLQGNKNTPFLNRAISGLYAPGSIIKPVIALAALEEKIIDPMTYIFSPGFLIYTDPKTGQKTRYNDWRANGATNMKEAIAVSSDVYFYQIGGGYTNQPGSKDQIGLGIKTIDRFAKLFNVDSKTGIDLFGEKNGNVPTPEWKKKVFNDDWRIGDTYISSIGQFGFLMTPIEALLMTALVAGEGETVRPHLLKNEDYSNLNKIKIAENIKTENYKIVKEGMRLAVTYGTAKNLNIPFTEVSAKTGTAEVGKNKEFINSWVVGFWPLNEPKYAFVVLAEGGTRGKQKNATLIMEEILWWMWENKKDYFVK